MAIPNITREEIGSFHKKVLPYGFVMELKHQKVTKVAKAKLVPLKPKKNPSNYGSLIYIRERNGHIVKIITTIIDEMTKYNPNDIAKVALVRRDGEREILVHKEEYPRTVHLLDHLFDMATAFRYVTDDITFCPICNSDHIIIQPDKNYRVPPLISCPNSERGDHANAAYPDFMKLIEKHGGNAWQEIKKRFAKKAKYDKETEGTVTRRKDRSTKWKREQGEKTS